ncbi:Histone-lysine N-methyltransferase MLL [Cucumis melo var. makuwa]|uniref:Histone-lysine N-methyltransferase MLL n=1 Tax=Cucumis melo var. makuwa TaxID=1194695 RepID=A0A5D3DDU1_CUCMM|nr:Histone-lysine N-methyltransferase MLL [Cucumis melo var. makuwa]TYK21479.1 Histone-lysine N-methyltransferase MLL [Cucumis melo var. makuwa]
MGRTTRSEKDVLKIIHPGKHIETYTKPILASEVLEKYPKFCITRPDVFKFPWIVVRSDSLLVPGKVFLLVPKRTLYRLLKTNHPPDGSLPSLLSSPLSRSFSRPSLPFRSNAGTTPKHLTHLRRSQLKSSGEVDGIRSRKNAHVESWLSMLPPHGVGNKRSTVRYSSSHVHDCYKCGNVPSADMSREDVENVRDHGDRKRKTTRTSLRSCMRKPGSAPRLPNLKVRFSIPNEDIVEPVAKQRTVIESLSKLATSIMVDVCR